MTKMDAILAVDDEPNILELLEYNLTLAGYRVLKAKSGEEALSRIAETQPSLVLLDLMLPGIDGIEVCRRIKTCPDTCAIPIIMVTAKGEESDRVVGLDMGADDYIVKPFSVRELVARVRALLRRVSGAAAKESGVMRAGDITLDVGSYVAYMGENNMGLTLKEFDLLRVLMQNRGRVLGREYLLDCVWEYDYFGETRTVDVHVRHLRMKLGDHAPLIETVRGVGYRFNDKTE